MYKLTSLQCDKRYGVRYVKDIEGQKEKKLSLARGIKENFIEELAFEMAYEGVFIFTFGREIDFSFISFLYNLFFSWLFQTSLRSAWSWGGERKVGKNNFNMMPSSSYYLISLFSFIWLPFLHQIYKLIIFISSPLFFFWFVKNNNYHQCTRVGGRGF